MSEQAKTWAQYLSYCTDRYGLSSNAVDYLMMVISDEGPHARALYPDHKGMLKVLRLMNNGMKWTARPRKGEIKH